MLPPPEKSLPPLLKGQRVYVCSGTPWNEALDAFHDHPDASGFRGWKIDFDYRKGDWILTYLDTRPRVFLCWEQALRDGALDAKIWVEPDVSVTFDNLVVVDHIEFQTGLRVETGQFFEGDDAARLHQAIIRSLRLPRPWHELC